MSRKLDFVIAGAQKSGTTTLYTLLRAHPQIQMAGVKETHVFDDESLDWSAPDYTALDGHFISDERLRGEATPITLYWRPAIRRLHAYNPALKLILMLRNPVERAFSHWRKEFANGVEVLPFAQAIRQGRERVREGAEAEGLHREFSYVERGFYGGQLAYLLEHFPSSQVHCELFEDFVQDRQAALRRITRFLEVGDFATDPPAIHKHRARAMDYPSSLSAEDAAYLAGLYQDDIVALESILGRRMDAWRPILFADQGRAEPSHGVAHAK